MCITKTSFSLNPMRNSLFQVHFLGEMLSTLKVSSLAFVQLEMVTVRSTPPVSLTCLLASIPS